MNDNALTRRSFVATAAAATALAPTVALAKESDSAAADAATSAAAEPAGTTEADVIVVGAGMGGLSAALQASDGGASVILLEAAGVLGGGTTFAEGMFGAGTKMQAELGITDLNPQEVLNIEFDFQNYNVNIGMWEQLANDSADDIDWLMDKGVVFDTVTGMGDTNLCWHVYEGWHGGTAVGYLQAACERQGVDIHPNTRATELIVEDGEVKGVRAQTDDGTVEFRGKAVILACGGFSGDADLVDQYSNWNEGDYIYYGIESARGDGLRMASEVTGDRPKNTTVCIIGCGVPDMGMTTQLGVCGAMEATNMWVNESGKRYVTETMSRQPSIVGNVLRCENQKTFSIFDQKAYDRFKTEGLGTGYGMYVPPGTVCDHLDQDVQDQADNGHWWRADTIEELAEDMGLDAATLSATLDEYNQACAAGEDAQCGKPADYLVAIDEPPFYGFEIKPIVLCTMGGIRIDAGCRVCDKSMTPVPGLYAASTDVSGFQGETYGVTISGSAQAIACWSGRTAAKTAAERL